MRRLFSVLLTCICLAWAIPAAADQIIGLPADPGTGNCFPFGCAYRAEYQQVYTRSQFSAPITITNLEFFNTKFPFGATAMNSGNWAISLSTTQRDWNSLSSTYSSNIGIDNTLVFSGNLAQPWAFGDTLSIILSTPFAYDPSQGNLLMDVNATNTSAPGGDILFDTNGNNGSFSGNTIMGRVYRDSNTGVTAVNSGYGLVTGFSTNAVPENATVLLLGFGIIGLAVVERRIKRKAR